MGILTNSQDKADRNSRIAGIFEIGNVFLRTSIAYPDLYKMGVNQSKGSVDITSTPKKELAPVSADLNGKTADEKIIDEKIKINGDAEKVTTNGDAKKDEVVATTEEAEKKDEDNNEATEAETKADETVEEADLSTSSEKKKISTKEKIKKRLSIRSINFLKRKKKTEDGNESKNEANDTKEEVKPEEAAPEEAKKDEEVKVEEAAKEETEAAKEETKEAAKEETQATEDVKEKEPEPAKEEETQKVEAVEEKSIEKEETTEESAAPVETKEQ